MRAWRGYGMVLAASLCAATNVHADASRESCERILQNAVNNPKYTAMPSIAQALDAAELIRKSGIDTANPQSLLSSETVTPRLLSAYIGAYEDYYSDPLANYADYDIVRVFSDPGVLTEYQKTTAPANPQSPARQLGSYGERRARIDEIALINSLTLSGDAAHGYSVRVSIDERTPAGHRNYRKTIRLALKYKPLELSARDACLNPAGFRIFSYDNSDPGR